MSNHSLQAAHYTAMAAEAHDFAIAQQNPAPQSSVEIESLAKPGSPPKITVKVYATDVDEAASRATALYDSLVARYAVDQATAV
jgi:hypothetical protein